MIHTINDSGLGVSDIKLLNCSIILDNPNKTIIPMHMLRQKTKTEIKTFLCEEAITALQKYIKFRQQGTRHVKPETITRETPLFVSRYRGNPTRMTRQNISTIIHNAFNKTGEKRIAAHSLRKALQTNLEKGGMPTNWIDQVLGHKLINSRDAYSLPTDEELKEAYMKAYDQIRIYPTKTIKQQKTSHPNITEEPDVQEAKTIEVAKQLLAANFTYQLTTPDGTMLFKKTKWASCSSFVGKRSRKSPLMQMVARVKLRKGLC